MTNADDILRRVYAKLAAQRDVLAASHEKQLPSRYVAEYHAALAGLAQLGFDVEEFKVAAGHLRPKGFEGRYPYFGSPFEEQYVDRDLLLMRIKAVLGYFELSSSAEEPRPIGFRPPTSR